MTPEATAGAALRAATLRLAAAGVDGAARDARLLLAHALGVDPARVVLALDAPLGAAADAFAAAVAARAARRPLSHITGRRAFFGRSFRVTPDVLDPRPETEALVALALAEPFARVLDLGTGSGCILITLLAERPGATGLGTDISAAALAVAAANAADHAVADRAGFRIADWVDGLSGVFDLIVSNPPYIAAAEMPALAPEVLHEPHGALSPGGDGLAAYRAIAAGAAARLAAGGRLLVEIGATQGRVVAGILAAAGWTGIAIRPDLAGRDRVVLARRP